MKRYKRIWILCLIPLSFLILMIVKRFPAVAEYMFARGIYRAVGGFISLITKWIPFSVAEIGIILIPFIILIILVIFVFKLVKGKGRRKIIFLKGILDTACLIAVIFFILTTLCLSNIHRYSIGVQCGLEVKESTTEELYAMCLQYADKLNEVKRYVTSDENGNMVSQMTYKEKVTEAKKAYAKISEQYPFLWNIKGNAKPVFFSRAMSYLDITGLYVPFTMEANVNIDTVDYSVPNTMCHELAHLQGYMKEDEANYIAYMVCIQSDSWEFVYSGYMMAYINAVNALYKDDAMLYTEIYDKLEDSVHADLDANSSYWRTIEKTQYGKTIMEVSSNINDSYLKMSGQENGVKSYGMVVDLLLAEYRKGESASADR